MNKTGHWFFKCNCFSYLLWISVSQVCVKNNYSISQSVNWALILKVMVITVFICELCRCFWLQNHCSVSVFWLGFDPVLTDIVSVLCAGEGFWTNSAIWHIWMCVCLHNNFGVEKHLSHLWLHSHVGTKSWSPQSKLLHSRVKTCFGDWLRLV